MNPPTEAGEGRGAIGSLSLQGPVETAVSVPYEAQIAMVSYGAAPMVGAYHVQPPGSLYYRVAWPETVAPMNSESTSSAIGSHSPESSETGEMRSDPDIGASYASNPASAQKTLFIAGLPSDVKEREIFNLLRFQPGFLDCSLTPSTPTKQAVAFASWQDNESAVRCRDLLQGMRFDPYGPATFLRVQFARSESKNRRTRLDAAGSGTNAVVATQPYGTLAVAGTSISTQQTGDGGTSSRSSGSSGSNPRAPRSSRHSPQSSASHSHVSSTSRRSPTISPTLQPHRRPNKQSPPLARFRESSSPSSSYGALSSSAADASNSSSSQAGTTSAGGVSHAGQAKSSGSSLNPPPPNFRCSTLFVTNLSMLTTEADLLALFEKCAGFNRLRFQLNTEGAPISFVDFDSEESSSLTRTQLQGVLIHHTPLRIEFAKQKMKKARKVR